MSIESGDFMPTPEKGMEGQNEELISRAEELATKFQEMLKRNYGEYPPTKSAEFNDKPSDDEREVMQELTDFFEYECRHIPSVEINKTEYDPRDELKKVSDTLWLWKNTRTDFEITVSTYFTIDEKRAKELLQASVEESRRQIQKLETKKQEAEKLLGGIK